MVRYMSQGDHRVKAGSVLMRKKSEATKYDVLYHKWTLHEETITT
jgi:hypothetical protein